MGIFDDIVSKETQWENDYKEYIESAKALDYKAASVFEELRSHVDGINTTKQKLIGPMNLMHEFLGGIGQVDLVPAYKDVQFEHIPGYVSASVVPCLNEKKYMNLISEYDTKFKRFGKYMKHRFVGSDDFSTRNMKNYFVQLTSKRGKEEQDRSYDLKRRQAEIERLELELKIAKLYHQVFAVVDETVEQVILKEIPFIKAFLYAQGVLEAVKAGNTPSSATPARIKRFSHSLKYKKHFKFLTNTHDFYTLLINYYQNDYLSRLLSEKDTAMNTVSSDLSDVQSKSQILKADSMIWRRKNG